ncbi:MAG: 50S ribosomal protein L32 [Thermodesulfobacteriota bacterium]
MPNPTNRFSRSRRNKRRAQWTRTPITLTTCAQCGESKLPHHICPNCGTYRGREYIPLEEA